MSQAATVVHVELFGVPRLLAGSKAIAVAGETLGALSRALLDACPALAERVIDPRTGWLTEGYIFVVNDRFSRDPAFTVTPGAAVLLVSSVAGG
ncbi:thiamine biosynthesis protein ThiS [Sphaerobacter sp.]|uniref:thiamine biosynthesis protein ThiS n=1 Tax=Sphaerobacter sp. TaxID=2099654 RepID=UPI001DA9BEBD|nr:thiamine biosynthesis protein ThiS [Sphaerobacter sp.]MBX5446543.1 thiamine biosynthesis protein ThiS [Sphaerobacter sp.]